MVSKLNFDLTDEAKVNIYCAYAEKVTLDSRWKLPKAPINHRSSLLWINLDESDDYVKYNRLWLKAYAVRSLLGVGKWR